MINALLGKKFIWVLNLKVKIENLGLRVAARQSLFPSVSRRRSLPSALHHQHQLAHRIARLQVFVGLGNIVKGIGSNGNRFYFASF